MRSPGYALMWEILAGHRRTWLVIAVVLVACSVVFRILGTQTQKSDLLQSLCFIPGILMLCLMMAIFNFTEVNSRKSFAGFPQRLFTIPIGTWFLVAVPMLCGMLSVVALYVTWTWLVFRPAGFVILVRWPATLLAAAIVFYQAIIWCLSGYRITRLFVLGFVMTCLVALGRVPFLPERLHGAWTEGRVTAVLAVSMLFAYAAAVSAVGHQRRGGEVGWLWRRVAVERLVDSIPHRRWNLSSPDRALLWIEWRRSGLVLPMSALFIALFILGPVSWLAGTSKAATERGFFWLVGSPLLLAIPISRGLAKVDFWSLELTLPAFLTARPIHSKQIVAAKLKSAAMSTLLTYAVVLVAATIWLAMGDPDNLHDLWGMFRTIYSPLSRWVLCMLIPLGIMGFTWTLLIGSLWLGYSGRPWFFYSGVAIGIVALVGSLMAIGVGCNLSDSDSQFILKLFRWIPWLLAAAFIFKCWAAIGVFRQARRRGLISQRSMLRCLILWAAGTLGFVALVWFLSPGVDWTRYMLYLAVLLALPLVRVPAATLAVAWNRHR